MSRVLWSGSWSLICAVGVGSLTLNMPAVVDCSPLSPTHSISRPKPSSISTSASAESRSERTRGIAPEEGLLVFDHSIQLYRSKNGVPRQLRDRDTVTHGDRIRASVETSEDAQVYLAFCSGGKLTVYPSASGAPARAGVVLSVPQNGYLIFDDQPGPEVLYLIVSRAEISISDPRLAAELAAAGPEGKLASCAADRFPKKQQPAVKTLTDQTPAGEPPLRSQPSADSLKTSPVRNPGDIVLDVVGGGAGSEAVIAVDAGGVAVVRYGFTHVAPDAQPASRSPGALSPSK